MLCFARSSIVCIDCFPADASAMVVWCGEKALLPLLLLLLLTCVALVGCSESPSDLSCSCGERPATPGLEAPCRERGWQRLATRCAHQQLRTLQELLDTPPPSALLKLPLFLPQSPVD